MMTINKEYNSIGFFVFIILKEWRSLVKELVDGKKDMLLFNLQVIKICGIFTIWSDLEIGWGQALKEKSLKLTRIRDWRKLWRSEILIF